MRLSSLILVSLAALGNASSIIVPRHGTAEEYAAVALSAGMSIRAIPDSPSGGYAPATVNCPADRPTIRSAATLSKNETAWLPIRRNNTVAPMMNLLSRANFSGFDAASYISKLANNPTSLPNIGIAISGGGYRALMNGAGFVAAADNRTINSTGPGQIGGLLQASTYLVGLSGGGWLVGSIFANNFSSVQTLRDGSPGSSVWKFGNSILKGPASSGISILNTAEYFTDLHDQVKTKTAAGFNVSITDYWGRALSYQLVNSTDGGPAFTFSSIALAQNFRDGNTPLPILVADERTPNTQIISGNSTVYEFNPFEIGSWDPTTYGFAPLRYIGSKFNGGVIPSSASCVRGFDQAGFMMGTSSSLFNQFLLRINGTTSSTIQQALQDILSTIGENEDDIADYSPNPFFNFNNATNRNSHAERLTLVDGGEDGQNVPLYPLIQPVRALDVIFAIDSSADTEYSWPNGTSLVATYERSLNSTIENGTAFPSIPDQNTFINLGLNTRPTFFGCNASNLTGPAPLLVYIPNSPYISPSNVSTFNLSYTDTQRNLIIRNGYDVATLGNGTFDSQWVTCVGCAILSRSFAKTGQSVPAECTACFSRYCWNGTLASQQPKSYQPAFKIADLTGSTNAGVLAFGGTQPTLALLIAGLLAIIAL